MNEFLAPSTHSAQQVERCFDRSARVVPPPVRTEFFTMDESVQRENFWLIAAALETVKRIDVAIEAANRTGARLVIAGSGSARKALQAMAGPTVEFIGNKTPAELRDLYRRARVFLFPSFEDFGIAPVEAMACGCPVAAFAGGGALDTVNETCGGLMATQTASDLIDAVQQIERARIRSETCRQNAERFSEAAFDRRMRDVAVESLRVAGSLRDPGDGD